MRAAILFFINTRVLSWFVSVQINNNGKNYHLLVRWLHILIYFIAVMLWTL